MSKIFAEQCSRSLAVVRGNPHAIADGIIAARVAFTWSPADRAYRVPLAVVDRLLVALENAGHRVDYHQPLW